MVVLSHVIANQIKLKNIIYCKDEDKAQIFLMILLIIMGCAGGTTMPSLTVLIAAWVPERERSKTGSDRHTLN